MQTLNTYKNKKRRGLHALGSAVTGIAAISLGIFGGGSAAVAATSMSTSTTASTTPYHVMIMTHLCNPSIKNLSDFNNISKGKDPVSGLAADVLACPTTGLPGDSAVAGTVASPRTTYDFNIMNKSGTTKTLADGTFMPSKLCESDINVDVNGDGKVSTSTCLDISHYAIPVASDNGQITVTENAPPAGYHFGALLFTPPALDGNNDAADLVKLDLGTGMITLNMKPDADGMIMLHVYDFPNASTTSTSTPTSGTTASTTASSLHDDISSLINDISLLRSDIANLNNLIAQLEQMIHSSSTSTS